MVVLHISLQIYEKKIKHVQKISFFSFVRGKIVIYQLSSLQNVGSGLKLLKCQIPARTVRKRLLSGTEVALPPC